VRLERWRWYFRTYTHSTRSAYVHTGVVDVLAGFALLYQEGQLISDADILIAATALKHHLVLVTENVNHFRRIPGLSIESWRV
jgi:hypothetical protein